MRAQRQTLSTLLFNAISDIAWYIINHPQSPATGNYVQQNNVRVTFAPQRMTWTTAEKVMDALETVIIDDNWTWASHVTISDVILGLIGGVNIQYRNPGGPNPTSSESGGGSQFSPPSGNSTFLANRPQNTPLTDRPEIPHPFLIPGSHISLVCTRYGQALDPETVFALLIAAQKSVSRRLKQIGPLATVDNLTPWKLNNVMFEIRLEPDGKLRWSDLVVALEGVVDFLIKFQTFEFTFEIRWEGSRSLGFGQLRGKG
ncbi:MAG: hypothetical protein LQ344_001254 [Seirophora lacunosa]|nr:MAG: hypothetical protein LQ344_001254 [Seirophora lacunosa]